MSGISGKFRSSGFTLIELMITVALIAVIATFAVPQMGRMIDNNRVISTTNSVVGLLNYARSEAIRRGSRVAVTFPNDSAEARLVSDGSLLRVIETASGGLSIGISAGGGATTTSIEFRATGMTVPPQDGSGNPVDVLVSVCSGNGDGRRITVNPGGKISSTDYTCP